MNDAHPWVRFSPGAGTALVGPSVTALIDQPATGALVEELSSKVAGGESFDEVLEALALHGFAALPDLAIIGSDGAGQSRVVVRGAVSVSVTDVDGAVIFEVTGEAVHTWAEHSFTEGDTRLSLGTGSGVAFEGHQVQAGVVPAAAVDVPVARARAATGALVPEAVDPLVAAPAPASEPVYETVLFEGRPPAVAAPSVAHPLTAVPVEDGPVDMAPAETPTAVIDPAPNHAPFPSDDTDHDGHTVMADDVRRLLGTPAPAAVASTVVAEGRYEAVRCPAGHPNPPHSPRCRACQAPVPVGPRELLENLELGVFRFSTGLEVPVDRTMLVGRSPQASTEAWSQPPSLVSVPSPDHDISRTHIEVRVEGWQVLVVDKGSVNGTTVMLPGRDPHRLRPDHPFPLPVGATVSLADEVDLVYEARG